MGRVAFFSVGRRRWGRARGAAGAATDVQHDCEACRRYLGSLVLTARATDSLEWNGRVRGADHQESAWRACRCNGTNATFVDCFSGNLHGYPNGERDVYGEIPRR